MVFFVTVGPFFSFVIVGALVFYAIKLSLNDWRKRCQIRDFVDKAISEDVLYPITGRGYDLGGRKGYVVGSSLRAAEQLSMDSQEAYGLIVKELKKRGLPVMRQIVSPSHPA